MGFIGRLAHTSLPLCEHLCSPHCFPYLLGLVEEEESNLSKEPQSLATQEKVETLWFNLYKFAGFERVAKALLRCDIARLLQTIKLAFTGIDE